MKLQKEEIANWLQGLQDQICQSLESLDGKGKFRQDKWERPGGGGGRSRIFENGDLIEKGGVNFSAVHGEMPENILAALKLPKADFFATGVSIVLHSQNPFVPIIHMNVRYFEMSNGTHWFGGGIDVTPHYINLENAQFFHQYLKTVCDKHSTKYHPHFKKWADDYFYIKHRKETRGIGGIFFDRLSENEEFTQEQRFDFLKDVGQSFVPIYTELANSNRSKEFKETNKIWQKVRRGRYVEFNLVYDRGTKFGLDTDGRIESILMSLPPEANWIYDFQTQAGSAEEETLKWLKKEVDWLNIL